jgi:hypothetical protein
MLKRRYKYQLFIVPSAYGVKELTEQLMNANTEHVSYIRVVLYQFFIRAIELLPFFI